MWHPAVLPSFLRMTDTASSPFRTPGPRPPSREPPARLRTDRLLRSALRVDAVVTGLDGAGYPAAAPWPVRGRATRGSADARQTARRHPPSVGLGRALPRTPHSTIGRPS